MFTGGSLPAEFCNYLLRSYISSDEDGEGSKRGQVRGQVRAVSASDR